MLSGITASPNSGSTRAATGRRPTANPGEQKQRSNKAAGRQAANNGLSAADLSGDGPGMSGGGMSGSGQRDVRQRAGDHRPELSGDRRQATGGWRLDQSERSVHLSDRVSNSSVACEIPCSRSSSFKACLIRS